MRFLTVQIYAHFQHCKILFLFFELIMKYSITINQGLDDITFGTSMFDVTKLIGEPTDKQVLSEDPSYDTIMCQYHDLGFSLFYENINTPVLTTIEVYNEEAHLWGEKIFNLEPNQIVTLFEKNGFKKSEQEDHTWGEHRITFEEANVDLYFENKQLASFSMSKFLDYKSQDFLFSLN